MFDNIYNNKIKLSLPKILYLELVKNPNRFTVYISKTNKSNKPIYDSVIHKYVIKMLRYYEDTECLFGRILTIDGYPAELKWMTSLTRKTYGVSWSLDYEDIKRNHVYKCIVDNAKYDQLTLFVEQDSSIKRVKRAFANGFTFHAKNLNDLLAVEKVCKEENKVLYVYNHDNIKIDIDYAKNLLGMENDVEY